MDSELISVKREKKMDAEILFVPRNRETALADTWKFRSKCQPFCKIISVFSKSL